MFSAYQLEYLLSGSGRATFAPDQCTPCKTNQPDASVPPCPAAVVSSDVAGRGGEHGAYAGSRQGSHAWAQELSARKHVALQIGAYFLNILSAERGQR